MSTLCVNMTESVPFYNMIVDRNIEFLNKTQKYHMMCGVLNYLFCIRGKRELFEMLGVRGM